MDAPPVEALVIGFGVDTEAFNYRPAGEIPPSDVSVDVPADPYLIYPGSYSEWHGAGIFVEAFARLREFVAEGEIDHLGVFPWSREEGTVSAMQPGRVDEAVAQARQAECMTLQEGIRAAEHARWIGRELTVMIDGESTESEFLLDGRHEGQAPQIDGKVIVTDATATPGDMRSAWVTQTSAFDLVATLDPSQLERLEP